VVGFDSYISAEKTYFIAVALALKHARAGEGEPAAVHVCAAAVLHVCVLSGAFVKHEAKRKSLNALPR
jgi:hypothetical protein